MTLLTPVDSRLYKGATQTLEHTARDVDGNVIDISSLSGSDLRWRLAVADSTAYIIEKTIGGGITITDGPNGAFDVDITAVESNTLTADVIYHWETFMTVGVDTVMIAKGFIQVRQPII